MSKRGQVTIFIIVFVLIIASIILFFLLKEGILPDIGGKPEENPSSFLGVCLEKKVIENSEIISSQGGYLENSLNKTFRFADEKVFTDISYLCYNQNYYSPCVNQEPMLISHLKKELGKGIQKNVDGCFDELTLNLDRRGYVVDATYNGFKLDFGKNKIIIDIDGKIVLTKSGKTTSQENLEVAIPSRFYDLSLVVQEIVSQEARFCNFENLGFMVFYPEFNIERFRTGDGTTIYTVQHKESKEKFKFAVRGCVIPPGF